MLFPAQIPGRRVTPQPSPSQLAMEERGLEKVRPRLTHSPCSMQSIPRSRISTPTDPNKPLPLEPEIDFDRNPATANTNVPRSLRKTSSTYSKERSHSIDSAGSLGTTISQILDLYTDLASQWSDEDDVPVSAIDPDLPILQPQAYRDTIAPLLQRRYSFEKSNSSLPQLPHIPTEPLTMFSLQAAAENLPTGPEVHRDQRAPTFQEFSRNLQGARNGSDSPFSDHAIRLRNQLPDISPLTTPQIMVDSSGQGVRFESRLSAGLETPESMTVQLRLDPDHEDSVLLEPASYAALQQEAYVELGRPGPTIRIPPSRSNALRSQRQEIEKIDMPRFVHQEQRGRSHEERLVSAMSDSTDSFVMYTGVTDTVKGMLRKKIKKRKAAKDRKEVMKSAAQKYPAMAPDQQDRDSSWTGPRRQSVEGVNAVLRRLSLASPSEDTPTVLMDGAKSQVAIPLTEYQKHGAQIWTAEAKKKRKEQRRQQKISQDSQVSQRSERNSLGCSHGRTTSQQSSGATGGPQSEQRGMMRGLKNSLVRSASQKRRDKLKASIVVMGRT